MQKSYEICEIGLCIKTDDIYQPNDKTYLKFIKEKTNCDIDVEFEICKHQFSLPADFLKINTTNYYFDSDENCFYQWDSCSVKDDLLSCDCWMRSNYDWSKVKIYTNHKIIPQYLESNFLLTAFQSKIAYFKGLFLHGAIVEHNKQSIVFTASSGVGKSTHSELWKNHFGDNIINGDKTFLRLVGNAVYAYGSPWSGSSGYNNNTKAPLAAIVVLEQSLQNSIKKLSASEALGLFTTHCYFPVWDEIVMDLYMNVLDEIIKKIPIYLLRCRPEKEAAVLVRDTVFSN